MLYPEKSSSISSATEYSISGKPGERWANKPSWNASGHSVLIMQILGLNCDRGSVFWKLVVSCDTSTCMLGGLVLLQEH